MSHLRFEINVQITESARDSGLPEVRRLPHAPLPDVSRQQEVRQQEHLHRDVRRAEMLKVRRLSTRQV